MLDKPQAHFGGKFTMLFLRSVTSWRAASLPLAVAAMLVLPASAAFANSPQSQDSADFPLAVSPGNCIGSGSAAATAWLKGNYSFRVTGIDLGGAEVPYWIVGAFTADGKGNLTTILIDGNGPQSTGDVTGTVTGTYSIASSGRGQLTIPIPKFETLSFCIALDSMTSGVAAAGHMVSDKGTASVFQGRFFAQGLKSISVASAKGSWVFGMQGAKMFGEVAGRQTFAGFVTLDGNGKITGGELDYNNDKYSNGVLENQYAAEVSITGTYTLASTGRGTFTTFLHSGGKVVNTSHSVFYIAGPGQILIMTSDPGINKSNPNDNNSIVTGNAYLRTTSTFDNATLSGSSVVLANGLDSNAKGPNLGAGIFTFNGKGAFDGLFDTNENGAVSLAQTTGSVNYSVDAKGRLTASSPGQSWANFYLIGHNWGIGVQSGTKGNFYQLLPQSAPARGFKAGSIGGTYSAGTLWYAFADQKAESGELTVDDANKTISAIFDDDTAGSIVLDDSSTVDYESATNGRFSLVDHGNTNDILYLVNPHLGFALGVKPGKPYPTLLQVNSFDQAP
jgi:hypothetical protein